MGISVKYQDPSTKQASIINSQNPNRTLMRNYPRRIDLVWPLDLGAWGFFEIWTLELGTCLVLGF
jgi:hypothetical protein